MGKKNKKKFIDKKHAVTFKLVSRSQRDPLYAAEGSEHVLMPMEQSGLNESDKEEQIKVGIYFDDNYNYLQHLRDVNEVTCLEPITERFRISRDGEVMDSDSISQASHSSSLNLPSSLFQTDVELEMAAMERAFAESGGPRPDWDPDIVAALDDDFDFDNPDNRLDDDFIVVANDETSSSDGGGQAQSDKNDAMNDRLARYFDNLEMSGEPSSTSGVHPSTFPYPAYHQGEDEDASSGTFTGSGSSDEDDDDEDAEERKMMRNFGDEETKSRFTEYSMTSSVIRRTEGLKLVDGIFEKFYEQYDDEECGELDEDLAAVPISGFIQPASDRMRMLAEEFEYEKIKNKVLFDEVIDTTDPDAALRLTDEAASSKEFEELSVEDIDAVKKPKWDCESIISTYSNLYNHPQLISERHAVSKKLPIDRKTGLPAGVLRNDRPTGLVIQQQLDALDREDRGTVISKLSTRSQASTYRPKDEAPEDRRARKQMIKQERRERRMEKKANKLAFKEESERLNSEKLNVTQNFAGFKIL